MVWLSFADGGVVSCVALAFLAISWDSMRENQGRMSLSFESGNPSR
jgi:hypothetical protein